MPRAGFEPTIPVFERAKTVHALDRTVTRIGMKSTLPISNILASSDYLLVFSPYCLCSIQLDLFV
jgi:hypothetical protein